MSEVFGTDKTANRQAFTSIAYETWSKKKDMT